MSEAKRFRRVANKEDVEESHHLLINHYYYSMGDILVNISGNAAIYNGS
jgi:hypothetical protein